MWNPFKKKNPLTSKPSTNSVDQLANRLHSEGRIKDLENELGKIKRESLSEGEQESWWHLYGIVAFREGRNQEAQTRFEEGFKHFPDSAQIRFSLGEQYVVARQIDRAFELFRANTFPALPRDYVLAQVRYAYLWGRYDDGQQMLRPFLDAYHELNILDDHFLHVRGMPFFGTWWSYFAALSILKKDTKELEKETERIAKTCQDYDFDFLKTELESIVSNRPEALLSILQKRLADTPSSFPNGYTRMRFAILQAGKSETQNQANGILNGVALSENDFRWLEDVRVLAQAEIAHRFGQKDLEKRCVDGFLRNQKMLFEPDIALNFNLLQFQETLKPTYQSS